jgi:hypothetical protein
MAAARADDRGIVQGSDAWVALRPAKDDSFAFSTTREVAGEPLDENEGAHGDVMLELDIPDQLFVEYEWVEEQKTYREALIPAAALNEHLATARRLTQDEEDEARSRAPRWRSR